MSHHEYPWQRFVSHAELNAAIAHLERKIMASQADIDAITTQVQQVATDLDSAKTSLQTEIDNLAANNPGVDLSGLQAAVAPLDSAVQTLGQLQPTPPADPNAPSS